MKHSDPKCRLLTGAACVLLLLGSGVLQSCEKDVLSGQPEWLGNSIYERLQDEGNYTYTLRLIDDLGQTAVLSRTGSKTLFAADDNAYNEFFKSNTWGVNRYEDLSMAQKKLLFNSTMVNDAYLIELLSNVSGNPPGEGQCMRRETAVSVFDSISRIYPSQMPDNQYWAKYKGKQEGMALLRDNTPKPMIHFLPAFMQLNKITDNDLSILTNGQSNSVSDAWVNGKKIVERDITCKNGYIHKVDGVMTSADNMAEIIHSHANMSTFSRLLDRFSAPYYDDAATKEYNRLNNTTDSVFVMRYFAETANTGNYGAPQSGNLNTDPDGQAVDAQLYFDPGWNQYIYSNTSGRDLHYDAGAMLVPTDKALDFWWNHDGKVLQNMYGTWENVPLKVLVKMMNINMINTFSETVPSKFANIVDNTTKVTLGVKTADIDSCFMGCNGVVYLTNKVFTPADYSSVSFPALVNQNTMNVIYWAIENLNFEPYLNSMDSYYSFIIPTNNAMLSYLDPCSYAASKTVLYSFYYDDKAKTVRAHRNYYDLATKTIDTSTSLPDATSDQVKDRMEDLLNCMIIVGNVEDGSTYYKSKGGSPIRVTNAGSVGTMTVDGGLQLENDLSVRVSHIYDQSLNGNGKSYVVDSDIPLTSRRSTYNILQKDERYSEFFKLIDGSRGSLISQKLSGTYSCVDYNISLFDAYNYTVYVPTNASIQKLITDGYLPTWDDYEKLTVEDFGGDRTAYNNGKKALAAIITNFLRYHIQDNSVFIGGKPVSNVKYETSKINPVNKRFFSLTVSTDANSLTMEDQLGNRRKVTMQSGLYNTIGREYWFQVSGSGASAVDQIYNASDVVVHQIDGPLFYEQSQLRPWREVIGLSAAGAKSNHVNR